MPKAEGAIPSASLTKITEIMRYYVSITEMLNRIVSVDASNTEEAINKVTENIV